MTTEVNYYRYYCQSESNFVYKWDTSPPTKCSSNNSHTIDIDSITVIDTISTNDVSIKDISKTQYQEVSIGNKSILLHIKSSSGKSILRDNFITQGTANIINSIGSSGEFQLLVTGTNDKAVISSVERTSYCGHCMNEACLGIRIPQTLTNNQYIQFGLYDNSNGFYFKYTNSGLGVGYRYNGTDSNFTQSNLNIDILNSNGISSVLLEPSKGYVYGIRVSGHGSKIVDYGVYSKSKYGDQKFTQMHRIHTNEIGNGTPMLNTSLPLNVEIFNNGTSGSNNVYVSDRTFGIYGQVNDDMRVNSVYVSNISVNSSSTFVPVVSIRKKNTFNTINTFLNSIDVITTSAQIIQILSGGTLTSPSWLSLSGQLSTETAIEYDESALAVASDGVVLWEGYVPIGNTTLKWDRNTGNGVLPKCVFNGVLPITVSAKNISSSGTIGVVVRTFEAW
jgi:hypothetical protein